jgi:hypothetical protein
MDEDAGLIYGLREQFDEVVYHKRENQDLKHSYRFSGGISEKVPSGSEGSFEIGDGESVKYTLDQVRGKPLLRLSHSFEEIDSALSDDGGMF